MNKKILGFIFLVITIVCYLLSYILVKLLYVLPIPYEKPFFISYYSNFSLCLFIFKNIFLCKSISLFNKTYELKLAFLLSPLFLLGTYLYDLSMYYTTITSAIVISSVSIIVIAIMSKFLLKRIITIFTIISLLVSCLGIGIIGMSENNDKTQINPVLGDIIAAISIIAYSLYTTLIKKYIPDDDTFDWSMFFFFLVQFL